MRSQQNFHSFKNSFHRSKNTLLIIYANETYHNHLASLAQSILDMADYSIETDEPCRPD
jgi:hypothetical protein